MIYTLMLMFLLSQGFSRVYYYCGSNGYCFQINEFTYSSGGFGYSVTYVGMCSGGPFVFQFQVASPQDPITGSLPEGPISAYITFASAPGSGYVPTTGDISEATASLAAPGGVVTVWLNPERINWLWAKTFAQQQNQSIFALTLKGIPYHDVMSFDLWSVKQDVAQVQLISQLSGRVDWSATLPLDEGRNQKTNIDFGGLTAKAKALQGIKCRGCIAGAKRTSKRTPTTRSLCISGSIPRQATASALCGGREASKQSLRALTKAIRWYWTIRSCSMRKTKRSCR